MLIQHDEETVCRRHPHPTRFWPGNGQSPVPPASPWPRNRLLARITSLTSVLTGSQAKAYANNFIGVHVTEIAAGQTYAQVSAKSEADPKNATLTAEKTALFQGETLRGLLLSAWGWSVAGIILIVVGGVLFLLPLANWRVNLRNRTPLVSA